MPNTLKTQKAPKMGPHESVLKICPRLSLVNRLPLLRCFCSGVSASTKLANQSIINVRTAGLSRLLQIISDQFCVKFVILSMSTNIVRDVPSCFGNTSRDMKAGLRNTRLPLRQALWNRNISGWSLAHRCLKSTGLPEVFKAKPLNTESRAANPAWNKP